MSRAIAATLIVTLCCGAACAEESAGQKALRTLFEGEDPAGDAKGQQAVLEACKNDPATLKALLAADTAYPPMKAGWYKRTTKVRDGDKTYDVTFYVRIPRSYTPDKPWPLLLLSHGQHGNGLEFAEMVEESLDTAVEHYVLISPTMPGPAAYSGKPYQEQAHLKPLAWARMHLNIDSDRIYATGYSQGGHNTWHLATMYPHLFAAAVPMAGVPWFEGSPYTTTMYLGNLQNLPVWCIWGQKDRADPTKEGTVDVMRDVAAKMKQLKVTAFRGDEVKGGGHGSCWLEGEELVKFLSGRKRIVAPEKLHFSFHLPQHARCYYLEAIKLAHAPIDFDVKKTLTLPPTTQPTTQAVYDAMRQEFAKSMFTIGAELDTKANTLKISAEGVKVVRVYVIEGMFDLAKPITIQWGAAKWTIEAKPSAQCMLKHYAAGRDAASLVCNEVDVELGNKPKITYP